MHSLGCKDRVPHLELEGSSTLGTVKLSRRIRVGTLIGHFKRKGGDGDTKHQTHFLCKTYITPPQNQNKHSRKFKKKKKKIVICTT